MVVARVAGLVGKADVVDKHEYFGLPQGEQSDWHLCSEVRWLMEMDWALVPGPFPFRIFSS